MGSDVLSLARLEGFELWGRILLGLVVASNVKPSCAESIVRGGSSVDCLVRDRSSSEIIKRLTLPITVYAEVTAGIDPETQLSVEGYDPKGGIARMALETNKLVQRASYNARGQMQSSG